MDVISLGVGVQSSTMLLMACHGEILPKPDHAIFADVGWEPEEVYRYFDFLKPIAEANGIQVHRVNAGNLKKDILDAVRGVKSRVANPPFFVRANDGETGMLRRACTRDYKTNAIEAKIRELVGLRPRQRASGLQVNQWIGISVDEIHRAKTSEGWLRKRYPLLEKRMNRFDCLHWLERHGYPRPPKSSCIGCPYHSDSYWRDMKRRRPDEWREAVEFDKAIRTGLPGVRGEVYLHRSMLPLEEVDLRSAEEKGQLSLFGDEWAAECDGVCGL